MPILELTSQRRSALRAAAHPLHPVVLIGDRGLTPAVLQEIERNLTAHELIKVRVAGADHAERDDLLAQICDALSCAPILHIGKTLIIYRPRPLAQLASARADGPRRHNEPYIPKKRAAHLQERPHGVLARKPRAGARRRDADADISSGGRRGTEASVSASRDQRRGAPGISASKGRHGTEASTSTSRGQRRTGMDAPGIDAPATRRGAGPGVGRTPATRHGTARPGVGRAPARPAGVGASRLRTARRGRTTRS